MGQQSEDCCLLTLVDRKSRYTLIRKVKNKSCQEVGEKTLEVFQRGDAPPCLTMTNDNGLEFGGYRRLEEALNAPIYFTHPYCSWERGTNENTNGLLREFFPKGKPMKGLKETHLEIVASLLNSRPRKVLEDKTPYEVMWEKDQRLIRSNSYYSNRVRERARGNLISFTVSH